MKLYIKAILIFSLSCSAYAEESHTFSLNYDSSDAHSAYGIAFLADTGNPKPKSLIVSFGLSINELESDLDLAADGRKVIYPVYFVGKLSMNYTISPFIEFGFDLGDAIIENIIDSIDTNDNDYDSIDTYYSLGLTLRLNKKTALSLYRKFYDIKYYETGFTAPREVDLNMTGISLFYYF